MDKHPSSQKTSSVGLLLGWALPRVLCVQFGALQDRSGWAGATPQEYNGDDRKRDVAGEELEQTGLFRHREAEGKEGWKGRKNEGKNEPSPLPEAEGEELGRGAERPLVVAARQRRGPGSAPARPSAPLEFPPRAGVGNVSGLAHPAGKGQAPGAPRLLSPGLAATPALFNALLRYHRPEKSFIHRGAHSKSNCHLVCPVLPFC